jgi:hypothetical protein
VKRYSTEQLVRWAALGACRLDGGSGGELFVERVGYVHPVTRAMHPPLTQAERAMLAEHDARLLAARPPWPAESIDAAWERYRGAWDCYSPAYRARVQRLTRLRLAQGYVRRLRKGQEWWFRKPLSWVRGDCVRLLRELGHARLVRVIEAVRVAPPQLELGL